MKPHNFAPYLGSITIRVGSAALAVIQTVVMARALGPSELGVYSAILAITTLLALPVAAGIPTYLTREIAKARVKGEVSRIRPLLRAGNRATGLLSVLATAVLIGLYSTGITPVESWMDLIPLMVIIPLMGWDLIRSGTMRGLKSALWSQIPENIVRPFSFILVLLISLTVVEDFSAQTAVYAFATACLISLLSGQILLRNRLPQKITKQKVIPLFSVIRENLGLALLGGTKTLLANLDILVIAAVGAYAVAGAYKVALQGVVLLLIVLNATYAVAMRDLASSIAANDAQVTMRQSDNATILASAGTTFAWIIILVFGQRVISIIFGDAFRDAYAILLILGIGHVVNAMTGPAMEILVMLEGQREALIANLISVAILLAGAFLLVGSFPVLGVAIASAVSNIGRNFIMARFVRKQLGFDPSLFGAFSRLRRN